MNLESVLCNPKMRSWTPDPVCAWIIYLLSFYVQYDRTVGTPPMIMYEYKALTSYLQVPHWCIVIIFTCLNIESDWSLQHCFNAGATPLTCYTPGVGRPLVANLWTGIKGAYFSWTAKPGWQLAASALASHSGAAQPSRRKPGGWLLMALHSGWLLAAAEAAQATATLTGILCTEH